MLVLAFLAVAVRPWEDDDNSGMGRACLTLFSFGSLAVLALTLVSYLGLRSGGSPRIANRRLARVQQVGMYARIADADSPSIRFSGDPIHTDAVERNGFQIPALGEGHRVRATAQVTGTDIQGWSIDCSAMDVPIRLQGQCVNTLAGGWLGEKDVFTVVLKPTKSGPERSMDFAIAKSGAKVSIGYSEGDQKASTIEHGLIEGAKLTTLLEAGNLAGIWHGKTTPLALQAGEEIDPWQVLDRICLVREKRGDAGSKVGVLIDPSLTEQGVQVLRNGQALDLKAPSVAVQIPNAGPATLSFGLTGSRRFALVLPSKLERSGESTRLVASLEAPTSYPLPPSGLDQALLITSGHDMVPLDGYVFPTGNDNHPFYSKAQVDGDAAGLRVQDGLSVKEYHDDDPILLGDYEQGIVARLHIQKPAIPHAGLLAILFLGVHAVLYGVQLWWRPRALSRADVAWTYLWVGAIGLLVVRLLLAYRCSLLPPDDASVADLASFHKALRVSLPALLIVPAAMAVVRFRFVPLNRKRDLEKTRENISAWPLERICLYLPLGASLVPILARLAGTRDDFIGFRTSIWVHLTLVAGLVAFAIAVGRRKDFTPETDKPTWRTYSVWHRHGFLAFAGLNLLALLMLVIAIGDNGSLIYGLSVGLAVLVAALPFRIVQSKLRRQGVSTPLVFGLAVAILGCVALGFNTRFFIQRFTTLHGTIAYRIASLDDMDPQMLLDPARTNYVEATQYRQNRDQQWQMLLYPAVAATDKNPGYGGAPLSRVALKYPTSMTDTTYAVYLLGEFGPWAGAFGTALYLVIMAACFGGAASARRDGSWWFVPLVAVGAFFPVNGLYMAAGDIGSVPFTGQNLPLLSLYSVADVFQCFALFVLASVLLRRQPRAATIPPNTGAWLPTAFGVLATVGWIAIAAAGLTISPALAEDLDAPEVLTQVVRRVDSHQVALNDDVRIDPKGIPDLTPIEKEAIQEFNLRPDKEDPEAGLYYAAPNGRGGFDLLVNHAYFHLTSPYRRGDWVPWRRSIFARSSETLAPRLYMLSNPISLSLNSGGYPAIAYLDSNAPIRSASAAILAGRSRYGRIEYAEYRRRKIGGQIVVTLKARLPVALPPGASWSVYVEGQPVPDAGVELRPFDLVSIEDRVGRWPRRFNMIYLGDQPEPLAFVRWRNGSYRRVTPAGTSFGMVANIGRVADEVRPASDLTLTLDMDLHQRLQTGIRQWCLAQPERGDLGWRLEDPEATKPVSMTLIDTFKGDILALPSFPHVDTTTDEFAGDLERSGPSRRAKLLRNWNFENHVIGSTIKPLTFSTMAAKLRPTYRLEDAVVHAYELTHDNLCGIPLGDDTAEYAPVGNISMSQFLTQSRTWPACVIGCLGLVESMDSLKQALILDRSRPDITLSGKSYRVDLLRPSDRIVSQDARTKAWVPRTNLSDTLLFQGLSECFGAQIPPNRTTEIESVRQRTATFFPSLLWGANQPMPTYATEIVPRRVLYECDSMRSVKQELLTSLIGGAQSMWNNVTMAESFARLCTGRKMTSHLEVCDPPEVEKMPVPISDPAWRERALLSPLEQVHISGTARSIKVDFEGYRAVMKTGTLGEKVDSESLMFTIGKFRNGGFVPGQTVTGYFFMRDTNLGGHMLKFSLADHVLPIVVDYLRTHAPKSPARVRPGRRGR